jgi:hypothetical protein
MSISADSRYADGELTRIILSDGTGSLALWAPDVAITGLDYAFYQAEGGDRLDRLAQRLYGDATKWWVIADMNPELTWPGTLEPGTILRLPIMVTEFDDPVPAVLEQRA